jgi:hypothetical protein
MNIQLNPYQITWAIITPTKGEKVIKKDLNTIYKTGALSAAGYGNIIICHFSSKKKAEDTIKKAKGLTRPYKVVFITDKQFGLSKWNESLINVATKKQLINTLVIY